MHLHNQRPVNAFKTVPPTACHYFYPQPYISTLSETQLMQNLCVLASHLPFRKWQSGFSHGIFRIHLFYRAHETSTAFIAHERSRREQEDPTSVFWCSWSHSLNKYTIGRVGCSNKNKTTSHKTPS